MYKNVQPYPEELQNLITFKGFLSEFYRQIHLHPTDMEAYEAVEKMHSMYFGKRKYSSYKAFLVVRARNIK